PGDLLDPGGFAPADPPRLRSRGPAAPLRSGGRPRGALGPLCASLRKRVQSSRFEPHNGLKLCSGEMKQVFATASYSLRTAIRGSVRAARCAAGRTAPTPAATSIAAGTPTVRTSK